MNPQASDAIRVQAACLGRCEHHNRGGGNEKFNGISAENPVEWFGLLRVMPKPATSAARVKTRLESHAGGEFIRPRGLINPLEDVGPAASVVHGAGG